MPLDREILDVAALWAVRTQEPSFEDWPAFTAWLEQNPEHGAAYDRVVLAAEESAAAILSGPANDEVPAAAPSPLRRFMPALAAGLAVVAALWVWQAQDQTDIYRTAPGEMRTIALADGSTIILAGGSQLAVDPDVVRYARLDHGRALFEIRHDESNPFTLEVGAATLVDAGTIFDVAIGQQQVSVGVSEGAVIYNPARQNARVDPGEQLTFDMNGTGYDVASISPDQVGEWRSGRLTFRDAALADVAADVSRATGLAFSVAEGGTAARISGSVTIDAIRSDPSALGRLLDINVRGQGDQWILTAP